MPTCGNTRRRHAQVYAFTAVARLTFNPAEPVPGPQHAVRHDPLAELDMAEFHLALLDLHAPKEETISVQAGTWHRDITIVTCTFCYTGNPFDAPYLGYPCPTIQGLLNAHRHAAGFRTEWTL